MPNPIGRRYVPSVTEEVEALKKELADLKATYQADMSNISADMSTLNQKIESTGSTAS